MGTESDRAGLSEHAIYIQSHLDCPLDLATLARQSGLSPFHFHRAFTATIGETPRRYIERLRLERAYRQLALGDDSIREVSRAVGFRNHETFSRSFRRRFKATPSEVRRRSRIKRATFLHVDAPSPSGDCQLSEVRFAALRPSFMLSTRRVGDYESFDYAPFTTDDRLWTPLARLARQRGVRCARVGWGFVLDIPGLTPASAQRFDACVCIAHAVSGARGISCLRFEGGPYAIVDHIGARTTLMSAYTRIVHRLGHAADRFVYREGPSLLIYRGIGIGGNPLMNHTTVCMPVTSMYHG